MIRELIIDDVNDYNSLGLLITDSFKQKYNLENELKKDYTKIYGYFENSELLGFIHIETIQDECSIINIVVKPEYRNRLIASKLLENVIQDENITKLVLEVKKSNIPAIKLYEKFDFKETGIRKGYYDGEDAIIMVRKI